MNLAPLLTLLILHLWLVRMVWRVRDRLETPATALICAIAPGVYGLGGLLVLLVDPSLVVIATGVVLLIPLGFLIALRPTPVAFVTLCVVGLLSWVAVLPRGLQSRVPWGEYLMPHDNVGGYGWGEIFTALFLGICLGLVVSATVRSRSLGGAQRRLLAGVLLLALLSGLLFVLLKPRLTHFPLVPTSLLLAAEAALWLQLRGEVGPLRSLRWSVGVQTVLVLVGALLVFALLTNLGVLPRSPLVWLPGTVVTGIVALLVGLFWPKIERTALAFFYPEAFALEERMQGLQDDLAKTQERLRQAEHLSVVGQLAAQVAHEIKNPLGPIKGYATILERRLEEAGALDEVVARGLQVIREEVETIDARARALLELSRPPVPEREPLDAVAILDEALTLERAANRGIRFVWAPEDEDPDRAPLESDRLLLRGVLVNLLRNAAQASPPDGEVRVRLATDPRGFAVWIDDDGPGVGADPEQWFAPFRSQRAGGTGLGLAIARGTVEALGGEVTLAQRPEGGTRATVRLFTANESPETRGDAA
ncbi:MAG: ATP-binding protein [Planctomycetota bacterium]